MTHIAAIPTVYNGVQFRSRLEARWAAFFDLCGWQWEYEPFDLNGWIPDFRTMHADGGGLKLWEIKPINELDVTTADKIASVLGKRESNYQVFLAGIGPECMWYFDATFDIIWIGIDPSHDTIRNLLLPHWKEAGNVTQWKSPRTQTPRQQRATARFEDFKLWDYVDPTETYEWLKDYYQHRSSSEREWAQQLQDDGFYRRAIEASIDADVYLAAIDCLSVYECAVMPQKEAKLRVLADTFDQKAKRFSDRAHSIAGDPYRPHESAYYAGIARSASEKAKALRAKIEHPLQFEPLNAFAENLFDEARTTYFKTKEGKPERVHELREKLQQHEDHVARYGPKDRIVERIRAIEEELDALDPSWCCAS